MSNFISSSNQILLWNAANKIPTFSNQSYAQKESDFKNIIENMYQKIAHKPNVSISELQQINRETIVSFLSPSNVKTSSNANPSLNINPSLNVNYPPINQTYPNQKQFPSPTQYNLPNSFSQSNPQQTNFVESREEQFFRQFKERQTEYDKMVAKPNIPDPSTIFKEKEEDNQKIQNMDVLIQQYQQQRESEFIKYAPPPIEIRGENLRTSTTVSSAANPVQMTVKPIKILEEISNPNLEFDDLDKSRENSKKSVSWSDTLETVVAHEDHIIPIATKEFSQLMELYQQLLNRVSLLEQKLEHSENIKIEETPLPTEEKQEESENITRELENTGNTETIEEKQEESENTTRELENMDTKETTKEKQENTENTIICSIIESILEKLSLESPEIETN